MPLQGDRLAFIITQGDALGYELLPFQGVWGFTFPLCAGERWFRACGDLPFRYAPVNVGSGRVGVTSENAYPLDSIKEGADEPVADDTCDVTYESNPGDVLHIPAEGNLLQAHNYHTSGTTDNQH